jgi:hypothetical protein
MEKTVTKSADARLYKWNDVHNQVTLAIKRCHLTDLAAFRRLGGRTKLAPWWAE